MNILKILFFISTLWCLRWDYHISFEKWQWELGIDGPGGHRPFFPYGRVSLRIWSCETAFCLDSHSLLAAKEECTEAWGQPSRRRRASRSKGMFLFMWRTFICRWILTRRVWFDISLCSRLPELPFCLSMASSLYFNHRVIRVSLMQRRLFILRVIMGCKFAVPDQLHEIHVRIDWA